MEILEQVQSVLRGVGIESEPKDGSIVTYISTGLIGSRMQISESNEFLKLTIQIPLFPPIYRRAAMCEAVVRANWNLKFGRFDMDLSDGQPIFHASLPIATGEFQVEALKCLVLFSWQVTGRYTLAFAEVSTGAAEPETAISRAEASFREELQQSQFRNS